MPRAAPHEPVFEASNVVAQTIVPDSPDVHMHSLPSELFFGPNRQTFVHRRENEATQTGESLTVEASYAPDSPAPY